LTARSKIWLSLQYYEILSP